jgi:hypothetical protein
VKSTAMIKPSIFFVLYFTSYALENVSPCSNTHRYLLQSLHLFQLLNSLA